MKVFAGVDLVNTDRIRKFLEQHSYKRISRLLAPAEKKRYGTRKISALSFARLFAAKEAFFKTLGMPWMGLDGFSSMEVTTVSSERFRIKILEGPLASKGSRESEGCYFRAGKLLGAQVVRWEMETEN